VKSTIPTRQCNFDGKWFTRKHGDAERVHHKEHDGHEEKIAIPAQSFFVLFEVLELCGSAALREILA
jgi:hypothetical protein